MRCLLEAAPYPHQLARQDAVPDQQDACLPCPKGTSSTSGPFSICDVYADRLIGQQAKERMDGECLKTTWNTTDHTHDDPPCLCTESGLPTGAAGENASKWATSLVSQRYVGAMPVYEPYFYYQLPRDTYPRSTLLGYNYATPKAGKCAEGEPLPHSSDAVDVAGHPSSTGCTWRRTPGARVVYGSELLANNWNNTVATHWPLHTLGPDTSVQLAHNLPVFNATFAALSTTAGLLTPRCCGC